MLGQPVGPAQVGCTNTRPAIRLTNKLDQRRSITPSRSHSRKAIVEITGADTLTFCPWNRHNFFELDDIILLPSPATPR